MTRRIFTVSFFVIFVVQMSLVESLSLPVVAVKPYANFAEMGETFAVNVTLTDVENLYGIELVLSWNSSILRIVNLSLRLGVEDYSDGILHAPVFVAKNETSQEKGTYFLAAASTAPAHAFNGSGNIVTIVFKALDLGSCRLHVETKLADKPPAGEVSSPIPHGSIDGFFGREVKLMFSPEKPYVNSNVTLSGSVIPPQEDLEVQIFYRSVGETGWNLLVSMKTDEQGRYTYTWQPQQSGKYEVKAVATIEDVETSSLTSLVVESPAPPSWFVFILIGIFGVAGLLAVFIYWKRKK